MVRSHLKRVLSPMLVRRCLPPEAGRVVLLTFDDGPHPEITPAVLERARQFDLSRRVGLLTRGR